MKLRLKLLKETHNLNLKEFAKTINLKESTTANYLSGATMPPLDKVEQIAKIFNVNPAWLVGWDSSTYVVEKQKIVTVVDKNARIPTDWKNDECGKLIKWTKRGKPVD